jgi:hypothetical protein
VDCYMQKKGYIKFQHGYALAVRTQLQTHKNFETKVAVSCG